MQYESNLANGFRDIIKHGRTAAWPDMMMTVSPPLPPVMILFVHNLLGEGGVGNAYPGHLGARCA